MHPFGGTPICPRCQKAVYAAEQIMGPGRKLYHKPCLACTSCNKRLDSYSLLEHDTEPYCKACHTKLFGTRDLRQANLPHRDDTFSSSPRVSLSPVRSQERFTRSSASPTRTYRHRTASPPPLPQAEFYRGEGDQSTTGVRTGRAKSSWKREHPNGASSPSSSPASDSFPPDPTAVLLVLQGEAEHSHKHEAEPPLGTVDEVDGSENDGADTGARPLPAVPRATPHASTYVSRSFASPNSKPATSLSSPLGPSFTGAGTPLRATATGTRYGASLHAGKPLTPTATGGWSPRGMPGSGTPLCAKCGKAVYFAEQVKASGKTFHKPCLRCTVCNTALDSNRLTEKDGQVMCRSCYGKLHGPQGSGYALLGKAGG